MLRSALHRTNAAHKNRNEIINRYFKIPWKFELMIVGKIWGTSSVLCIAEEFIRHIVGWFLVANRK